MLRGLKLVRGPYLESVTPRSALPTFCDQVILAGFTNEIKQALM